MCLLQAPTGWGKTLAAAAYARDSRAPTLWIHCHGECPDSDKVIASVLSVLSQGDPIEASRVQIEGTRGANFVDAVSRLQAEDLGGQRIVVLDDCRLATADELDRLLELSRVLLSVNMRTLVTSRAETRCAGLRGGDVLLIDQSDLAIATDEVKDFSSASSSHRAADLELHEASGGHPALFNLMLSEWSSSSTSKWSAGVRSRVSGLLDVLVESGVIDDDWDGFSLAVLLKQGSSAQLSALGVPDPCGLLMRIRRAIPLVRVSSLDSRGEYRFWVHDLVEQWLLAPDRSRCSSFTHSELAMVCGMLAGADEFRRALSLLVRLANRETRADWLLAHGRCAVLGGASAGVVALLESFDIHALLDTPQLLLLWAESLLSEGRPDEAIGKARAACDLASHQNDTDVWTGSMLAWIGALERLERYEECIAVAERLLQSSRACGNHDGERGALLAITRAGCSCGRLRQAQDAICHLASAGTPSDGDFDQARIEMHAVVVRCLMEGSYAVAIGELSAVVPAFDVSRSAKAAIRGNLATVLLEAGRTARAAPLAAYSANEGDGYQRCAYLALPALVESTMGRTESALALMDAAYAACVSYGCEYDLAVNRIGRSIICRTLGRNDEALAEAERGLERLSVMDFMGFRRLAAIEVAASLLALGDVVAARRWVHTASEGGFDGNAYHALRAAMVLAECDRHDGLIEQAIERLAEHQEHIASESSNWQMAMYVRAFPELLGMLARAVGAGALPIHMLRMVLPEYAERALRACKSWMDADEWETLGRRVLGGAEFSHLEQRKGQPICRVRMFGGLDVTVADRRIAERDWKKRKARLMFAMLVAQRGQDLPREQLLEYLWPELPEDRARNNFYVAWSAMKAALMGPKDKSSLCPYLENSGARCRIVRDAVRSDVDEFEHTLAQARAADSVSDVSTALDAYARLSAIYRGDLLPGDVYDDWFTLLRDRYRFDFVDAMMRAASLLEAQDDPCEALVYARRALQVDPLREDLYQVALKCHIAAGQRSGAIDTFIQCKTRLADELGLDPSNETMALYQEILVMEDRPRRDDYGFPGKENVR